MTVSDFMSVTAMSSLAWMCTLVYHEDGVGVGNEHGATGSGMKHGSGLRAALAGLGLGMWFEGKVVEAVLHPVRRYR